MGASETRGHPFAGSRSRTGDVHESRLVTVTWQWRRPSAARQRRCSCGLSIARNANLLLPHPPRLHSTRRSCVLQTETPGHLPNQKEPSRKTQVEDWNSLHSFLKHHGWGYLLTVLLSVLSVCSADTSAALLLREKLKVALYLNSSLNKNYVCIHTGQN